MTINISQHILGLKGQRVNEIKLDARQSLEKVGIPLAGDM